ncbi:MAG: MASE1 domain-containing protein [Nitrospirae bacterium]|nr:MASE1 domain-containing protein [Nitrospirota bacterium]
MTTSSSNSMKRLVEIVGIATLYTVTGKIGFLMAIPPGNITAVWPPSGISLAAVLLLGSRVWPGIWLGSFVVNNWFFASHASVSHLSIAISGVIAAGSAAQALIGAFLIHRLTGTRNPIDSVSSIFQFVGIEMVSCLVASSIGTTSMAVSGFSEWENYSSSWWTWWLGDFVGIMTITPFLLVLSRCPQNRWASRRIAEAALILTLLLISGSVIFSGNSYIGISHLPVAFLFIPFMVWVALRFGSGGVVVLTLFLTGLSIWGTNMGSGPFVREKFNESLMLLQSFISIICITGLVLSAALRDRERTDEALRSSERRLVGALNIAEAALISVDESQKIIQFDQIAEQIFGYSPQEILGRPLSQLLPLRFTEVHRQHLQDFSASPVKVRRMGERKEVFGRRKDGSEFPAEAAISKLNQGGRTTFTAVIRDISERKGVEQSLRRYSDRLKILHEIDRAILSVQSSEGVAQVAIDRMKQLIPYYRASVVLFDLKIHEATVLAMDSQSTSRVKVGASLPLEAFDFLDIRQLTQGNFHSVEDIHSLIQPTPAIELLKADGVRAYLNVPLICQSRLIGTLNLGSEHPNSFTFEDVEIAREMADLLAVAIQQTRLYEQVERHASELEIQAMRDPLTGIPNRILLFDRLHQAIQAGQRENRTGAFGILDLDFFKEINDSHGHLCGDEILKQIGPRIRVALRESDTLARLGGDEFGILLPNTDQEGTIRVSQKILNTLQQPFTVEGRSLNVTASLGIAFFPEHGEAAGILISRADMAMYRAKKQRNRYAVYAAEKDVHPEHL